MAMNRIIPLCVAAVLLAACSDKDERLSPPCPSIVIVQELTNVTQFLPGDGRDLTDVVMQGKVTGFDGFCETDREDDVNIEVAVDLRMLLAFTRGPANTDRKGSYSYFVAIADRDDTPMQKHIFESSVTFTGNKNRVAAFEELTLKIPLRSGENGGDYTVLVGFQLTTEQVDFNRTQGPR
jgi:hypothetical protein